VIALLFNAFYFTLLVGDMLLDLELELEEVLAFVSAPFRPWAYDSVPA
jgi:hypothetical protein